MKTHLRIATRKSDLAIWQAEHVAERLCAVHDGLTVELLRMTTTGDQLKDAPLAKVGGKGLFVKELERALFDGTADIAVHSMKDVPMELPQGLVLPVILERADPRDGLVSRDGAGLAALAGGATLGTSSLRRACQVRAQRPDLAVVNLRGSVITRLSKVDDGSLDATILAVSGLERIGLGGRITESLEPQVMLPSVGQGALGIELRVDDAATGALIAPLNHVDSWTRVTAERAMNRRLGGGCQVPIAGYAELEGDTLWLRGLVASPDGATVLRAAKRGPATDPETLGRTVAEDLLAQGAGAILDAVYADA